MYNRPFICVYHVQLSMSPNLWTCPCQTTCPQIYPFLLFFPKTLTSCSSVQIFTQTNTQSLASNSAIGLHLLQSPTCAQHYDDSRFSILAQGRSPFHPSALEATFIKTSNPALCRQKKFVYSLKIVH